MEENKEIEIRKYYALLTGLRDAINQDNSVFVSKNQIDKYNKILSNIHSISSDNVILDFYINNNMIQNYGFDDRICCKRDDFLSSLFPVINYLKDMYVNEDISKIGTLYSTITNEELKKRCLDILSSKDAFDRVINQATQVLEEAIKKKSKLESERIIGVNLVAKAINPKIENTILLFSNEPDIQEAYYSLYRGVIGAYRNPTHHSTDFECTREDALKTCAFIDYLLKELDHCQVLDK